MEANEDLFNNVDADVAEFLKDEVDKAENEDAIVQLLVGDGKKFKSIADLARSVVHKEQFIEKLKEENRNYRSMTQETKTVDEILKALKTNSRETNEDLDRDRSALATEDSNRTAPQPTLEETVAKVIEALESKNTKSKEESNLNTVKKTLLQTWGSDYANNLVAKAAELELSPNDLNTLAARSPEAFYKLIGVSVPKSQNNVSPKNVFQSSTETNKSGEKNFAYFEKIRKTDPRRYESSAVQNEMLQSAFKMGENFYR